MLNRLYRIVGKRAFDLLMAVPVLLLVSPVLALTALLVRCDARGPAFFVQERLGRGGVTFRAFKFRTMLHQPRTGTGEVLGKTDEVTRVGYWLRRFKIDELPQLWNIVRGDMSLVGPRPALPAQVLEYDDQSRRRLLVRPGLTGLAQVNGNIYLPWPERWVYDCAYVDRLSIGLDVWILVRTLGVIVAGEARFLPRRDATDLDAERTAA